MRVWLITAGELLPIDGPGTRLLRSGILSRYLAARGHDVTWWTSTFNHVAKQHRFASTTSVAINPKTEIVLLKATGYQSNVSLRRLVDHFWLALQWWKAAARQPAPDLIVSSLPTLEFSAAATRYGRRHRVPVVIDVRDLWPDLFMDAIPQALRRIGSLALMPYRVLARYACRNAASIVGPTEAFVMWGKRLGGFADNPDRSNVFPFGYSERKPDGIKLMQANTFWNDRGVVGVPTQFVACFFGALGRQFDLATVVQAARILASKRVEVLFVICGDGASLQGLRASAADLQNVLFPGWVTGDQIWSLMRMCKVGLAPYRNTENFAGHIPNKAIEYLSAGLPVLTSLNGTLGAMLAGHRCGATYQSPAELAGLLERWRSDPGALAQASENAYRLFQAEFVEETVYGRMVDYLETVAFPAQESSVLRNSEIHNEHSV